MHAAAALLLALPLAAQTPWRAWLDSPGGELPFGLELGADRAVIHNGRERIDAALRRDGAEVRIGFAHYDAEIVAREVAGELRGTWRKRKDRTSFTEMPFRATAGVQPRFPGTAAEGEALARLPGRWAVAFARDPQPAVGIFETAADGSVTGTFLTTLGDYRYLAGSLAGDRLRLSCFDGAHAFLFAATLRTDGTLIGDFWSGDAWHETWTARRDAAAALPDALALTRWVPPAGDPFGGLAFPDLDGRVRALADPEFGGKARILLVFGSWCPNCHDEAADLAELARRYRGRGLAVLGLAFERTGDLERDAAQVRTFVQRHRIDFPILIAGLADKAKATQALPLLDEVRAYPTTVFLAGDGRVHAVHTGYSGPATGEAHRALRARFETLIEELLAPQAAYADRDVLGWTVRVNTVLLQNADLAERTLAELHGQLWQIARAVPEQPLAELRAVPIWVELEQKGTLCMAYHPSAHWLQQHGYDPAKARSVEIGNARTFLAWTRAQPWMVLHELAHAYHDRALGFDEPRIRAAFENAEAAGRYAKVLHVNGSEQRHYALTDHKEYFAEGSEALFGTNDMFPFVRAELERHDPELYGLLREVWKIGK
jgi:thiol-disulfide isomerase/thioredoxin